MGTREGVDEALASWLCAQPMFFVATAPLNGSGHVNCSPKGNRGEFAVIDSSTVTYLDQTGSGIETIAHLRENGRITIMFCAFTGAPRIVRLQGHGTFTTPDDPQFSALAGHFDAVGGAGNRAVIVAHLDRVADSCGYGVPIMQFDHHRPALDAFAAKKGAEGMIEYQQTHNLISIDNLSGLDARTPQG